METKEELMVGLERALYLMKSAVQLKKERDNIRSRYYSSIKLMEPWTVKKKGKKLLIIGVVAALYFNSTMVVGYIAQLIWFICRDAKVAKILAWVSLIGLGALVAFIVKKVVNISIAVRNKRICEENEEIKKKNESIWGVEREVIQKIKNVQKQYTREIAPWYPSDYCYIEAAEFFLNAIRNYRADNLKEAINLYEDVMHKRRLEQAQQQMLNRQEDMIRQQRLNNLLQWERW